MPDFLKRTSAFVSLAAVLSLWTSPVYANPQFSHAETGDIRIEENGAVYNIYSADRTIGAFNSFSNSAGETINSIQASADHSVIFKVIGQSPSEIFGALNANSRVFLVNPNGIIFQPGSQVNAPGLVAASMDLKSANFDSREFTFEAPASGGYLLNQGNLSASPGGYIALLGSAVENRGTISSPGGAVSLASGGAATVGLDGDGGISVKVTKALESPVYDLQGSAIQDGLKNSGSLSANGGAVLLTTHAMDEVFDQAINHTGVIEAQSAEERNGVIILSGGSSGFVAVDGVLDATGGSGKKGGSVQVTGEYVALFDNADINASGALGGGTVLIGGDYKGENPAVPNSTGVYFAPNGSIRSDATIDGDGGKVILWSDVATRAYGTITAVGAAGGQGGFVETSGKNYLAVDGARVIAGQWLLDPYDVTISAISSGNGGFSGTNPTTWTPTATGSNIQNTTISTSLSAGTSVIVNTAGAGGDFGDITVDAVITKSAGGAASLTLNGTRNVIVNSPITSTSGALNVILNAGTGDITLAAAGNILNLISGNATLTAAAGVIAALDPSVLTEIKTTGSVTLSARGTGANPLSLEDVTSLSITDQAGAGNFLIEERAARTILSTTITVMTASSQLIDINYFDLDVVDINDIHTINAVSLLWAGSSFTYTASVGGIAVTSIATDGAVNLSTLAGGITATSIVTTDGGITLSAASGNLSLTTLTAGGTGHDISLSTSTTGNVGIDNATADDIITVNSVGSIQENGSDGGSDLTADSAHLTAGTGIGSAATLETDLDILTLAQVTGAGNIDLRDTADLTVTNATTFNGMILLSSATTLQVNNASSDTGVPSGVNDIYLTNTSGDMTIGVISSDDIASFIPTAGNILDGNGESLNVTATTAIFDTSYGHDVGTPSDYIEVNATTITTTGVDPLDFIYICEGTECDETESAAEEAGLLLDGNRIVGGENFEEFQSDSSTVTGSLEESSLEESNQEESGQDESQEESGDEGEEKEEGEEKDSEGGADSGQPASSRRYVSAPANFPDEKPVQGSTFAPCAV